MTEDEAGVNEMVWTALAIKSWMKEWSKQNPLQNWSIDNCDGYNSYHKLGMEVIERQWIQKRLEPKMFHSMRAQMHILEADMDEVRQEECTTREDREREWGRLRDVAMSLRDDYHPDVVQNCQANSFQMNQDITAEPIGNSYTQFEKFNIHDADSSVNNNKGSFDCLSNSEGSSKEGDCCESRCGMREMTNQRKVWHQEGQQHIINGWSEDGNEQIGNHMMGCMIPMRNKRSHRGIADNDGEEEECGEMVCNMDGDTLGSLPFLITVDSGVCASVMFTSWRSHVPLRGTPQSQAGEYYRAAIGQTIYNEGERLVPMMTQAGALRDMRFTVCDVAKALGSVSQMCRTVHRVVFNPPWDNNGSYIEHLKIVEGLWMQQEGGLYVLNTKVAPMHKQTASQTFEDFHWQIASR